MVRPHSLVLAARMGVILAAFCMYPVARPFGQGTPAPTSQVKETLDKGKSLEGQSKLDEAARLYDNALANARVRKDRAGEVAILTAVAGCLTQMRKTDDAVARFESAASLYEELGDKKGRALALSGAGIAYRDAGQSSKSIPYFEKASALFRELGDKGQQGKILVNLSRCYLEQRDTIHGLECLERAKPLVAEAGDKKTEAIIVFNMAGAYAIQGDNRRAIETFKQSLPLLVANGQKVQLGLCYTNLGFLSFRAGDFLGSMDYQYRGLRLQQESGDTRGIAITLDRLASNYSYLGDQEKALDLAFQAVKACESTSDLRTRAQNTNNLGRIIGRVGKYAEEKKYVDRALDLYIKIDDKYGQGFATYFLGINRLNVGAYSEAAPYFERARLLLTEVNDKHGIASCILNLGKLAEHGGDIAKALDYYRQGFELYQDIDYSYGETNCLAQIASLEERRGRLQEAEQYYGQALALQERLRQSLGALNEAKSRFQDEKFPFYQRYINLMLRMGQDGLAFAWVQKAKARSLLDMMSSGNIAAGVQLSPEDIPRSADLKRRDKELTKQWLATVASQNSTGAGTNENSQRAQNGGELSEIRKKQQALEREWQSFQDQLTLRTGQAAMGAHARTARMEEVAKALPQDTALLEYVVLRAPKGKEEAEKPVLFVTTRMGGKPRLAAININADFGTLVRQVQQMRAGCAARPNTAAERPFKEQARALYRSLVEPAEHLLAGKRRLVICPDGPLWDLPFQALLGPSSHVSPSGSRGGGSSSAYLYERFEIAYEYSATGALAALGFRGRRTYDPALKSILVLADPEYGANGAGGKSQVAATRGADNINSTQTLFTRSGALSALPNTRLEASAISAAFPGATLKLGKDAQESFVKQSAGGYRYLHFAAHALVNDAAPTLSGVVLARPPRDSQEDGVFTVRELMDMRLSSDLIVFSACDTGRGVKRRGEGMIGLTWAAFAAGAPSQVVSQWSVDDAATAQLMGGFYRGLRQGSPKGAALRASALTLMRDGKHSHPFYWAPFVLMGDWR